VKSRLELSNKDTHRNLSADAVSQEP
jgi:hypothetical protein